jgi:hypothetical protein
MKISGVYQVLTGAGMIGIWILNFWKGEIPELQTEPYRIAMHILAEAVTAIMLLVSGFHILMKGRKLPNLFNIASGALIYTLIASPGYFAQMSHWGAVAPFLVLLGFTVVLLILENRVIPD